MSGNTPDSPLLKLIMHGLPSELYEAGKREAVEKFLRSLKVNLDAEYKQDFEQFITDYRKFSHTPKAAESFINLYFHAEEYKESGHAQKKLFINHLTQCLQKHLDETRKCSNDIERIKLNLERNAQEAAALEAELKDDELDTPESYRPIILANREKSPLIPPIFTVINKEEQLTSLIITGEQLKETLRALEDKLQQLTALNPRMESEGTASTNPSMSDMDSENTASQTASSTKGNLADLKTNLQKNYPMVEKIIADKLKEYSPISFVTTQKSTPKKTTNRLDTSEIVHEQLRQAETEAAAAVTKRDKAIIAGQIFDINELLSQPYQAETKIYSLADRAAQQPPEAIRLMEPMQAWRSWLILHKAFLLEQAKQPIEEANRYQLPLKNMLVHLTSTKLPEELISLQVLFTLGGQHHLEIAELLNEYFSLSDDFAKNQFFAKVAQHVETVCNTRARNSLLKGVKRQKAAGFIEQDFTALPEDTQKELIKLRAEIIRLTAYRSCTTNEQRETETDKKIENIRQQLIKNLKNSILNHQRITEYAQDVKKINARLRSMAIQFGVYKFSDSAFSRDTILASLGLAVATGVTVGVSAATYNYATGAQGSSTEAGLMAAAVVGATSLAAIPTIDAFTQTTKEIEGMRELSKTLEPIDAKFVLELQQLFGTGAEKPFAQHEPAGPSTGRKVIDDGTQAASDLINAANKLRGAGTDAIIKAAKYLWSLIPTKWKIIIAILVAGPYVVDLAALASQLATFLPNALSNAAILWNHATVLAATVVPTTVLPAGLTIGLAVIAAPVALYVSVGLLDYIKPPMKKLAKTLIDATAQIALFITKPIFNPINFIAQGQPRRGFVAMYTGVALGLLGATATVVSFPLAPALMLGGGFGGAYLGLSSITIGYYFYDNLIAERSPMVNPEVKINVDQINNELYSIKDQLNKYIPDLGLGDRLSKHFGARLDDLRAQLEKAKIERVGLKNAPTTSEKKDIANITEKITKLEEDWNPILQALKARPIDMQPLNEYVTKTFEVELDQFIVAAKARKAIIDKKLADAQIVEEEKIKLLAAKDKDAANAKPGGNGWFGSIFSTNKPRNKPLGLVKNTMLDIVGSVEYAQERDVLEQLAEIKKIINSGPKNT